MVTKPVLMISLMNVLKSKIIYTDNEWKFSDYEQVLDSWEKEINWEVKNPLIDAVS